ncbi:bacteriocin [Neisseria sp.]|uniref:bacteriocin n=1 Tax=Neisseria sp. TaxID=192066 RepID=UPI0035A07F87
MKTLNVTELQQVSGGADFVAGRAATTLAATITGRCYIGNRRIGGGKFGCY